MRCNSPEYVGDLCRWPSRDIPWSIVRNIRNVSEERYRNAIVRASKLISAECGAKFSEAQHAGDARVLFTSDDDPGPTLGKATMPCGRETRCFVWIDNREDWNRLSLDWVVLHEFLHAIGVPHTDVPGNVMNPTYDAEFDGFGNWDKTALRLRYGEPIARPTGGAMNWLWRLLKGPLLAAIRRAVQAYDPTTTPEPYDDVMKKVLLFLLDALQDGTLGSQRTLDQIRHLTK